MAQNEYTCFVISRIGNKMGSEDDRKLYEDANTVMTGLILPTLRICGFPEENVVRSDQEANPGRISESIEAHLRKDDLCIADLTGLNPNVMYEYGVRVGIGKPIIAISAESPSKMPFDVKDVRTLQYDIKSVSGLMESQRKLEQMVRKCIDAGFSPKSGSGSYAELSERLKTIETQLSSLLSANSGNSTQTSPNADNVVEIIKKLGSPIAAFNYALETRDVQLGEALMSRLKAQLPADRYVYQVLGILSSLGSSKAAKELKASWQYVVGNLPLRRQYEVISAYISYCNRVDSEVDELDFISKELDGLIERIEKSELEKDEKDQLMAGVYNQINRLYHGAYETANHASNSEVHREWLEKAIESLLHAVELVSNEASYYYNLAICLDKAGRLDEAKQQIDKCLNLSTKDSDHLQYAYGIYTRTGNPDRANEVKEQLLKINPYAAAML